MMKEKDFVFWLRGFVELNGGAPTQEQWATIKTYLESCFRAKKKAGPAVTNSEEPKTE